MAPPPSKVIAPLQQLQPQLVQQQVQNIWKGKGNIIEEEEENDEEEKRNYKENNSPDEDSEKETLGEFSEEQDIEAAIGPITKGTVCLLCKRRFPNEIKLERHCQLSDLHKTNLQRKRAQFKTKMESKKTPVCFYK